MNLSKNLLIKTKRILKQDPLFPLSRMVHTEKKLEDMGLTLPPVSTPAANYILANRVGNHIYASGHISIDESGEFIKGKLGSDLSTEQGYAAAKRCGLSLLATLKKELGDLDLVEKVVKVNGFVSSESTFYEQPQVINGVSDLFAEVLGDRGTHARSAVGVNVLPLNIAVEVEAIFLVKDTSSNI
eukprot:maker-scaffold_5-snap-gene-7.4-mRNA-1 protein AED:0.04 eAED:0.04 QI:99/1/1/1/1/1/3/103/184